MNIHLLYLGAIPFDEHLRTAVRRQRALLAEFPGAKSARAIRQLAKTLYSWKSSGKNTGKLAYFFEQLLS